MYIILRLLPAACVYISLALISACLYMEWPISKAGIPLSKDSALSSACGGPIHFGMEGVAGYFQIKICFEISITYSIILFNKMF